MNRREFIANTGKFGLSIACLNLISLLGCKQQSAGNKIYPDLSDLSNYGIHKPKLPVDGCLFGICGFWETRMDDFTTLKDTQPDQYLLNLKDYIGFLPAINSRLVYLSDEKISYPALFVNSTSSVGTVPYVYLSVASSILRDGSLKSLLKSKTFTEEVMNFARGVRSQKIPFFVSAMREINTIGRVWRTKTPGTLIEVWKKIWTICEDMGANEYLTWIMTFIPQERSRDADYYGLYYPDKKNEGKYIDMLGISAYPGGKAKGMSSEGLIRNIYNDMQRNHPHMPIMLSEVGVQRSTKKYKDGTTYQSRWIESMFKSIKNRKSIKGLVYWNTSNWTKAGRNYTLNKASLEVIKKHLTEGYFKGAGHA